jgi:hypothetical protein
MQLIIVDIDNTICRTNEMIRTKINDFADNIYPFPLPEGFFENNPDVYLDAEPAHGAANKLHEFLAAGNRLFYVTAREPWTKTITEFWLAKHSFPKLPVFYTRDKRSVALRLKATLCIEDAPHELQRLVDIMPAFVPAKKYNESFERRFEDWSTLDLSLV